jgi:hypothetical protein
MPNVSMGFHRARRSLRGTASIRILHQQSTTYVGWKMIKRELSRAFRTKVPEYLHLSCMCFCFGTISAVQMFGD